MLSCSPCSQGWHNQLLDLGIITFSTKGQGGLESLSLPLNKWNPLFKNCSLYLLRFFLSNIRIKWWPEMCNKYAKKRKEKRKQEDGNFFFFFYNRSLSLYWEKQYPNVYEPIVKNIYIKHEEASTKGQAIHTEGHVWPSLVWSCLGETKTKTQMHRTKSRLDVATRKGSQHFVISDSLECCNKKNNNTKLIGRTEHLYVYRSFCGRLHF